MTSNLHDHRIRLMNNPSCYTQDLCRVTKTIVPHLKRGGYVHISRMEAVGDLSVYIDLVFRSQQSLPYLHIDSSNGLPYCWNRPSDWNHNYIRYEWGHLRSLNLDNDGSAHDIANLCLMSARCNQHIQSSLNINDLLDYEGKLAERIKKNQERRSKLFASSEWRNLLLNLEQWA